MTPRRGAPALVAAFCVVGAAVAGCTASSQAASTGAASSQAPVTSTSAAASSSAPAPSSTAPTTSKAATSSSVAHSSSALPTTPASVAPRSTCTKVTIRVIRGSASQGTEFAALQFTNAGTSTCRLYGYPKATLHLHGKAIGSPAQPATAALSRFTLSPGATAESRLIDYTSCQGALSDEVRVVVPGSSIHSVRPAQLRACTLRVSKLGQPE